MSSIKLGSRGHVYALITDSHPYVKLGATTLHPEVRAFQLTCATASPHPFTVLHFREVPDCNAAEAALHERFDDRRVNGGREFFAITHDEAGLALDELCGDRRYVPSTPLPPDPPTPWAELFATFQEDGRESNELTEDERAACRQLRSRL